MDTEYTPGDRAACLTGMLHADDFVATDARSVPSVVGYTPEVGLPDNLVERLMRLLRQVDR